MAVDCAEIERRVAVLAKGLRESGLRLTHQRLEVAREIAASEVHPDVEAIYCRVRNRVPTVSLDTVYRTVATLVELGLVNRVSTPAGSARYDPDVTPHHHYVCTECGLIRDVHTNGHEETPVPDEASSFGTVELVRIQFRGTCNQCAGKQTKGAQQ